MTASYLPSISVPLVGSVFPAITMISLFIYIERDEILQFLVLYTISRKLFHRIDQLRLLLLLLIRSDIFFPHSFTGGYFI
uniref:Photosystem I reaction center subunit VIII n=2 Tax=Dipteris conjugata TaxID=32108 RepID=A0A385GPE2_9MONI|nr:photosystem I subunit VIII [Dipteris conjugata]